MSEGESVAKPGVKRKLVAILAADVVSYSRLVRTDEAGTLAQLKAHRKELIDPTFEAYDGVVSDSWWKLVFGVAPDHDGCSIRRRGQSAS